MSQDMDICFLDKETNRVQMNEIQINKYILSTSLHIMLFKKMLRFGKKKKKKIKKENNE